MRPFAVVTCNACKELDPAQAAEVVELATATADAVLFQEIETPGHRNAIRHLRSSGWWVAPFEGAAAAVPIALRRDRFTPLRWGQIQIHPGQRGVSPARFVVWVVARDRVTRREVVFMNGHLISQAFTSHRERRPRWNRGARVWHRQIKRLTKKYGAVIGGADWNRSRWVPAGSTGVWASRGTHGASVFYDALLYAGDVDLIGTARRIPTASDHDALAATFTLRSAA